VLGDSFLHVNRADAIVEHTEPLPTLEAKPSTAAEREIGRHIVGLIEPGATLQMGSAGSPTRSTRRSRVRSTWASTPR